MGGKQTKEYARAYYLANREKFIARAAHRYATKGHEINERDRAKRSTREARIVRVSRKYKVSLAAAEALMNVKACEICGRDDERLHTDHCHDGGHVRGRLCMRCNRALGAFGDDPTLVLKAAYYLAFRGTKDAVPEANTAKDLIEAIGYSMPLADPED